MTVPPTSSVSDDPVAVPPGGRLAVLRHRQFALLFAGQAVSALGDRIVMVAGPFAVLAIKGAGPTDVALVLGANAVAFALFVLVGGVAADRLPRRLTMLASDGVRAVVQALAAALLLSGSATVLSLAALQLLYGAAEAFFRPAAIAMVPQVVPAGDEQPANALMALSLNVSMVVGPTVAGLLVAGVGPGATLAVDAATFVVSALSLLRLRPRAVPPSEGASFRAQLVDGWRHVRRRTWVWSTLVAFSAYHALVLPALWVYGPKFAQDHRGGSAAWGLISSGFGTGAVVGSVLALRWRPARPGVVIGTTLALASCQVVVVTAGAPTLLVAAAEAVCGVGVSLCFTVWDTALQQRIPAQAQARVSSFDHLVSYAFVPLGYAVVGPLAAGLGLQRAAVLLSAVSALTALAVGLSRAMRGLAGVPGSGERDEVHEVV